MTRSKAERSEFAIVLSKLLDETGIHTRDEWIKQLGVTQPAISQWVNDRTLPRPEILRAIVVKVRTSKNTLAPAILKLYDEMTAKPAGEVSPLFQRKSYRGITVADYVLLPLCQELRKRVNKLPADKQEEVLLRALALLPSKHKQGP